MGTPARSLGSDTHLRVCVWCLSPFRSGDRHITRCTGRSNGYPGRRSQSPNSLLTDRAASPPANMPPKSHVGLSQRRIHNCSRSAHE